GLVLIPRYISNFNTEGLPQRETDFLIIGSGIAGLYAALKAKDFGKVTILTKKKLRDTNTKRAQGGIAAAIHSSDSPALHRADTLEAGAGLCNVDAVEVLVNEGPDRVRELIEMGANFDRLDGKLAFTREAAHSRRRILHAGDSTGEEIQNALANSLSKDEKVEFLEFHIVIDLLTRDNTCYGALVRNNFTGEVVVYYAKAVVLAAGGAGQVFENTTNPDVATGDGISMAFRAGAAVMDVEFVQFHPTALFLPGAPRFLISEAVRGEGAILRNIRGERFMPNYHPGAELASRDIVARSIRSEMAETGSSHVYLDLSPMAGEKVKKRFPTITKTCAQYGIDIANEMIPVAPAAHYMMGGVHTNLNGETSVKRLYACGEVACQGVHGANRLASNSLLDGLVFGHRIIEHCKGNLARQYTKNRLFTNQEQMPCHSQADAVRERIKNIMWDKVGIVRDGFHLQEALAELYELEDMMRCEALGAEDIEVLNLLTLSKLITEAAIMRTESRGGHFREDFTLKDDVNWKKHIGLRRNPGGDIYAFELEVS
ncbi:MAG TPA: L-aspartate oxidase, partial [Desulfobacteria bacterium]|nr:L-aspartate oxidase [Desulfobacteria bacterium]